MIRDKILRQRSYWTEMLENAKENNLSNNQIADEIIKGIEEALNMQNVGRNVSVEIEDRDIATIEALHDLLLDAHGYSLDFITLKRARELTAKMYKAFD